jgi:hypothetical protein
MTPKVMRKGFESAQAAAVADLLGVDLAAEGIRLEAFRRGMELELEHGTCVPQTDVTHDDPILTGKIALAHLRERPDYYERLEELEQAAERGASDELGLSHVWLRFEHQFN